MLQTSKWDMLARFKLFIFWGLFMLIPILNFGQYQQSWNVLKKAKFKQINIDELYYADLLVKTPKFDLMDGKAFTITGYYIPVEDPKVIIISRAPMASCFFCGAAGLESVMEIRPILKSKTRYKTDQLLTYRGILKVNDKDVNQLPFILEQAEILDNAKK
ncbi:MAG TPA: hypothetical protein PLY70_18765 [Saprospiraceae bacterium]|nr:hypothetical protein [Saprospiraceae bacterium]